MAIMLLVIGIAFYIWGRFEYVDEDILNGFGTFFILVALVVAGLNIFLLITATRVVPAQIAIYEEENAKIESQITTMVNQYMEYEGKVISEVADGDSAITLVTLYPELKSDKLVQTQIEIYVSNNNKIKELKEKQTKESFYRFWLYFGK